MKVLLSLALLSAFTLPAFSQDNFIRIQATGTVTVPSDSATVEVTLSRQDETVDLTQAAFSKAKLELEKTFNKMEFPNLELVFNGPELMQNSAAGSPAVGPPMFAPRLPGAPAVMPVRPGVIVSVSKEFTIREVIQFRIEIEPEMKSEDLHAQVHHIVDNLKDAGVTVTSTNSNYSAPVTLIRYGNSNIEQATEKATEKAFAAARKRATFLAEMSGRMLGKVVSIEEKPDLSSYYGINVSPGLGNYVPGILNTNGQFGSITVRVNFVVTFEIK